MTAQNGTSAEKSAALILKNKGHQITLYQVEYDPQTQKWSALVASTDDEGNPVAYAEERAWVKWDANSISEAELKYGSMEAFEKAMNTQATSAVRWSLATILGRDEAALGAAMIPGKTAEYASTLGTLISIANGVDPMLGPEMLRRNFKAIADQMEKQDKAYAEALAKLAQKDNLGGTDPGTGTPSSPITSELEDELPTSGAMETESTGA